MLRLKGCPHCHGDLYSEHDGKQIVFTCLQCGRSPMDGRMMGMPQLTRIHPRSAPRLRRNKALSV